MTKVWNEVFAGNLFVPPAKERLLQVADGQQRSDSFALQIFTIELPRIEPNAEYQVRACFYDSHYRKFFGRPWKSRWLKAGRNQGQQLHFNEVVYFHSSLNDATIFLVLELVRRAEDETELVDGWSQLRVWEQGRNITEMKGPSSRQRIRLELNTGSARILEFLQEPPDSNRHLVKTQSVLNCQIYTHRLLARAYDFVPQNTLIGQREVIPGLKHQEGANVLLNPVPLAPNPAVLDNLMVQLGPQADRLEQELCELVNRDRIFKENLRLADVKEDMVILERRVRIGVHNGWTYLHEPFIFHLTLDGSTQSLNRKSGKVHSRTRSWDSRKASSTLVLRNRVELNQLVTDPNVAVVFMLDFIVGMQLPTTHPNPQSQSMTVCWGAWCPFADGGDRVDPSGAVSVSLLGGPGQNPDSVLCFKNLVRLVSGHGASRGAAPTPVISLRFHFTLRSELPEQPLVPSQPSGQTLRVRPSPQPTEEEIDATDSQIPTPVPPSRGQKPSTPTTPAIRQPGTSDGHSKTLPPVIPQRHLSVSPGGAVAPTVPKRVPPTGRIEEVPSSDSDIQPAIWAMAQFRANAIPRSLYAMFARAKLQPIVDRHGETPMFVDATAIGAPSLSQELNDLLDCNEIILQFMALASLTERGSTTAKLPSKVFFTFNFYRFPAINTERLLVSSNSTAENAPKILRRIDSTGALVSDFSGFLVKFMVDPGFLKPGEVAVFLQYLIQHCLYIDVWDADSLMFIGTASLPLAIFCRRGREAVQSMVALPVVTTELSFSSDSRPQQGSNQDGAAQPTVNALLYLTVANVGLRKVADTELNDLHLMSRNPAVIVQSMRKADSNISLRSSMRSRGLPLNDSSLVSSFSVGQKLIRESFASELLITTEEQRRKAERMQNVRQIERGSDKLTRYRHSSSTREVMSRELQAYKLARVERKPDALSMALLYSITTCHTIYPSLGAAEFMEYLLENPYDTPVTVQLEISAPELTPVTRVEEWRFFKRAYNLQTPLERQLFLTSATTNPSDSQIRNDESPPTRRQIQLFLKPRERIHVPFKYQATRLITQPFGAEQLTENGLLESEMGERVRSFMLEAKTCKVVFKRVDSVGQLLSVFLVQVEPRPHIVHQTLRFYHQESTVFAKLLRISSSDQPTTKFQRVLCSDATVFCELRSAPSGTQDVLIKTVSDSSPHGRSFELFFYADEYTAFPLQTMRIYLHALRKVDVQAVQGAVSRFSIVVKENKAERLCRAFASTDLLHLTPSEPFVIHPGVVKDIDVEFTPTLTGQRSYQITVVDVELQELLQTWLVSTDVCKAPVSKNYQVTVPIRTGTVLNKKIAYRNPYSIPRLFRVTSNRPDLLAVKDEWLRVDAKADTVISLQFLPRNESTVFEVLLHIANENGQPEDAIGLKLIYAVA